MDLFKLKYNCYTDNLQVTDDIKQYPIILHSFLSIFTNGMLQYTYNTNFRGSIHLELIIDQSVHSVTTQSTDQSIINDHHDQSIIK